MSSKGLVLIASTSVVERRRLAGILGNQGYETRFVFNSFESESALEFHGRPAVLVIDAELLEPRRIDRWSPLLHGQPSLPMVVTLGQPTRTPLRRFGTSRNVTVLRDPFDRRVLSRTVRDALVLDEAA